MIETWKRSDISDNETFHGDLDQALAAITADTLVMPGSTDLYFTAEDSHLEARRIRKSIYLPIPSVWGHRAGNPVKNPEDEQFIARAVKELLAS
jgi:homoserine O-acetyltransferase